MKVRLWAAVALAGLSLHATSARADDDDKAVLAKLDAIEKRLGNIEALAKAQGGKTPFSFTLAAGPQPADWGAICRTFGYNAAYASPTIPAGGPQVPTTVVCYGPPPP